MRAEQPARAAALVAGPEATAADPDLKTPAALPAAYLFILNPLFLPPLFRHLQNSARPHLEWARFNPGIVVGAPTSIFTQNPNAEWKERARYWQCWKQSPCVVTTEEEETATNSQCGEGFRAACGDAYSTIPGGNKPILLAHNILSFKLVFAILNTLFPPYFMHILALVLARQIKQGEAQTQAKLAGSQPRGFGFFFTVFAFRIVGLDLPHSL